MKKDKLRAGANVQVPSGSKERELVQTGDGETQATEEVSCGHESSDLYVPGFVAFVLFMLVCAFIMHASLWGWLKSLSGSAPIDAASSFAYPRRMAPGFGTNYPKLQIAPNGDLQRYARVEDQLLTNYTWFNKQQGLVRIPVREAMERVVANGLPHWGPTNRTISPLEFQRARARNGGQP